MTKKILLLCFVALFGLQEAFAQAQIKVLNRPDQAITVDGVIDSQWKPQNRLQGAGGLEWYVAHDGQNLYVARKGGDNGQPQLIYIQARYAGHSLTNTPFNYDNFVPNFSNIGGINFVAYLKSGYDEFRTRSSTAWSQAQIALSPAYGSGAVNTMEMFIPWNFITDNVGVPDSINIVFYQTNGNAGSIQSFGVAPDNNPVGGATPAVTTAFKLKVLKAIPSGGKINFGSLMAGQIRDTTVLIQNFGNQALQITQPTLSGSSAFAITQQPEATVPMKLGNVVSETAMKIRFAPATAGAVTGLISIASNDPVTPVYSISLEANGTQAIPKLAVKYGASAIAKNDTIRLGNAVFGDSVTRTVVVKNVGLVAVNVTSAAVTGAGFSIASTSTNPIAIGDSLVFNIKFKPTQANLAAIGGFSFASNDPDNATYNAVLKATSNSPAPEIKVTSNTVNYNSGNEFNVGLANVGNNTLTSLTIENTGTATLNINNISIANSTEFTITGTIPTSLAAGSSVALFVRFEPTSVGTKTGILNINSNDNDESQFVLNLKGVGVAGLAPDINVVRVAANPRRVDGNIETGWPSAIAGGTLDWHVTWSRDSIYFAKRNGGGGNEPVLIYLHANYKNAQFTANNTPSTSMPYDGFAPNFAAMGGVNFVAFVKSDYDEFRTWNAQIGSWTANNTGLNPRFGANNTMEIAIPWSAVTRNNGIPDSLRWVSYQTNGNPNGFFAYGQMPNANPFGANLAPVISQWISRPITTQQPHNSNFNFGNLSVGANADTTFTIQNLGEAYLNLSSTSVTANSDFSIVAAPTSTLIEPNNEISNIKIRFAPTSTGNKTAQLTITSDDADERPYIINLSGNGQAVISQPVLMVKRIDNKAIINSGATYAFGNVTVGTNKSIALRLFNRGNAALTTSASINNNAFSVVGTIPFSIAAGDSADVTLLVAPIQVGALSAVFSLANNAPNSPFIINLTANGTAPVALAPLISIRQGGNVYASGGTFRFGWRNINAIDQADFTVRNYGTDTLRISNVALTGSSLFSIANLTFRNKVAPNDSTVLGVKLTATNITGEFIGQLAFTNNATANPYLVNISAKIDSALTVSPANPNIQTTVTLTYNANLGNGALRNVGRVYIHTGIITSSPTGTDWTYVQGTWGTAADSVRLDSLGDGIHRKTFNIKNFYNLPASLTTAYRLGMVFRDASGTFVGKTTTDGDFFVKLAPLVSVANKLAETVKIYPNPAQSFTKIQLPENETTTIEVYNAAGQKMYAGEAKGEFQLDTRAWANGLYLVKIQLAQTVRTSKLVISQ